MSRFGGLGHKLYAGEVSFDFIGRRKQWYIASGVILLVAIAALGLRGLNLGIEFRGGAEFAIPNATCSVEDARGVAETATGSQAIVTETASGTVSVQTEAVTPAEANVLAQDLADTCGATKDNIKIQVVGPTWGEEISKKALQGLVVFILLVSIFLSVYFEWRMAVAALVALVHDLVITIGIYALTGLQVTPATVIGLLTILGYSLYDTVVVFDKVKENTRGIAGQSVLSYSDAANLAVNQTIVRSINTSIVALLPVLAIIIVGAGLLGAGTLLDLAVALAIGMAAGAITVPAYTTNTADDHRQVDHVRPRQELTQAELLVEFLGRHPAAGLDQIVPRKRQHATETRETDLREAEKKRRERDRRRRLM